jgi:Protein of unknown function (DUF2846)
MKMLLIFAVFAASALAQDAPVVIPPACGPQNVVFKASVGDLNRAVAAPEPGKALVYFIQDAGPNGDHQHYTLKIGLDGAWVGAYKNNSYFQLSVEPGEHHICANIQSDSYLGSVMELAHFTAEPGTTYFFRTRFLAGIPEGEVPYLHLEQTDSDEGTYLVAAYPPSQWKAIKQQVSRPSSSKTTH